MLIRPQVTTTFQEGMAPQWQGGLSLDKLTFRTVTDRMNKDRFPDFHKGPLTLRRKGPYSFVTIHAESLDPVESLDEQVKNVFQYFSYYDVVKDKDLEQCSFDGDLKSLKNYVKLTEVEFAFDFYGELPFVITDTNAFRIEKGDSYYSLDYHKSRNKNGQVDEKFNSVICIYNRSKKAGLEYHVTRLEFRIAKPNLRCVFYNYLNLPFPQYLKKMTPYLAILWKSVIPRNAVWFDMKKLSKSHPELFKILRLAGWE